jgi:ATP-dependent RNA helicase DHX37/DHR1
MGYGRERYNAKARGSAPGKQKKKGKQKGLDAPPDASAEGQDPNALVFLPKSQEVKENERDEKIRREVCATHSSFLL